MIIAVLVGVFVVGTAFGYGLEYHPKPGNKLGIFGLPGLIVSYLFGIGPHDDVFLQAYPLFNGVAYAGSVAFVIWLKSKISK
jgi:hypothetical protein